MIETVEKKGRYLFTFLVRSSRPSCPYPPSGLNRVPGVKWLRTESRFFPKTSISTPTTFLQSKVLGAKLVPSVDTVAFSRPLKLETEVENSTLKKLSCLIETHSLVPYVVLVPESESVSLCEDGGPRDCFVSFETPTTWPSLRSHWV